MLAVTSRVTGTRSRMTDAQGNKNLKCLVSSVRLEGSKDSSSTKGWDTGVLWCPVMKETLKESPRVVGNEVSVEGTALALVGYAAAVTNVAG